MRTPSAPPPRAPRPLVTRPGVDHATEAARRARAALRRDDDEVTLPDDVAALAALRLAIGKDGLGIELARPAALGPLAVVELVVRLPSVRFPFDVSGGIARFRHKRGELERMAVELDARRFARWAEPRLRGLLSPGPCTVQLEARAFGASVTVFARTTVSGASPGARLPALAFEVALVPGHGELTFAVYKARGAHLREPATTLAMRAMTGLLGDAAARDGARFVVADAAGKLARGLLPEAGVRAPGSDDVRLQGSGAGDGVLFVAFVRGGSPAKTPEDAALSAETSLLTRAGDDARMAGDLDLARQLDLAALERAPRHPEVARRIAEIDATLGGRADAATATLRDIAPGDGPPPLFGLLAGELLADAGQPAAAIAALLRAAEHETSNVIAALAYGRAADLSSDGPDGSGRAAPGDALGWLDAGIARAPRLADLRWERARRRIEAGRLTDARADFQELEALARGARDRHDVLRRAADIYRSAGLGADAALLYERALLYRPDDPAALAGLGASLASGGRAPRGAAILAHAIEIAESKGLPTGWMLLELGRVLGERLGDRPAAVARLRDVPDEAPEAIAARGLEGVMRAQLGDPSGAALAFARMRERAGKEESALPWLDEAARFEEERGDLPAAQAHLAAAIAIRPSDSARGERYRAIGIRIAEASGVRAWQRDYEERPVAIADAPVVTEDGPTVAINEPLPLPAHSFFDEESETTTTDAAAEARLESLTRSLQGDPTNDAVVDELVTLLSGLGRSMELLALLSARLEDAPPERREALLPKHRETLETLEREARAAGRAMEADLFQMAREAT